MGQGLAEWKAPELVALLRAAEASRQPGCWVADIDAEPPVVDTAGRYVRPGDLAWTGKFRCGGEEGSTWCTYNDESWTLANVRWIEVCSVAAPVLLAEVEALAPLTEYLADLEAIGVGEKVATAALRCLRMRSAVVREMIERRKQDQDAYAVLRTELEGLRAQSADLIDAAGKVREAHRKLLEVLTSSREVPEPGQGGEVASMTPAETAATWAALEAEDALLALAGSAWTNEGRDEGRATRRRPTAQAVMDVDDGLDENSMERNFGRGDKAAR